MTIGHRRQVSFHEGGPEEHPAVEALRRGLPAGALLAAGLSRGEAWAQVAPAAVPSALLLLRDHPGLRFDFLADLAGVHRPDRPADPLEVVYHLLALTRADRFRLRARIAEGEEVPSATGVFPGAAWPEREAFDLLGIRFSGHPDLRRILNPDGFDGHPLRKDFPVRGKVAW